MSHQAKQYTELAVILKQVLIKSVSSTHFECKVERKRLEAVTCCSVPSEPLTSVLLVSTDQCGLNLSSLRNISELLQTF